MREGHIHGLVLQNPVKMGYLGVKQMVLYLRRQEIESGVMEFSRLNVGDPTVAVGLELDIIAAVVIGGGSLSGGEGSILGTLIGVFIMAFLRNGSTMMGWPNYIQEIIIGIIIIAAVSLDRLRHRE